MKKTFVLILAVALTLAASVTAFANISTSGVEQNQQKGNQVEATSHGSGACRHAGCKCSCYKRLEGGAGKCCCGHWDYIHN